MSAWLALGAIGAFASLGARGAANVRTPKTYAELEADLRGLGMGVLGTHFLSGTLRTCSTTAPSVGQYLMELGHVVGRSGSWRYGGHVNTAALTSDRGWVSVDPTYMQFHCKFWLDEEDDEAQLDELMEHFEAILEDGLAAFDVEPIGGIRQEAAYRPPDRLFGKGRSWREVWDWKADYARRALRAAAGEGRMRRVPWYAELLVARRRRAS